VTVSLDTDLLWRRAAARGDSDFQAIATRAGLNRSVVSRLFAGAIPTLANLTALARAYDLKLDDLVPAQDAGECAEPVKAQV